MKKYLQFLLILWLGSVSLSQAQTPALSQARESAKRTLEAYSPQGKEWMEFRFVHQRHRFGDYFQPWQTDTQSLAGNLGIRFQQDPLFYKEDYFTDPAADTQWLCYQLLANEIWTADSQIRDLGSLSSDFYL